MVNRQRRVRGLPFGEVRQRNGLAFAINHKHLVQRADVLGVNRVHLHHHLILVQRLVNGGYLALTKGVIQQAVGCFNADPQTRHGFTVVDKIHFRAVVLLV
mgnify:CR=1 FL=1